MSRVRHSPDLALAKQLHDARAEAGLTQEELGIRLGIGRTHVGRIEKGLRSPRMPLIRSWLKECGYVLETLSPGSPDLAAALADTLAELPEHELVQALRILRAWPRLRDEARNAILGIVTAYEA
jgi:transcriptional regulator with XRE-family HTH domain